MIDKLSDRIRQFTFTMSELHGTKDDAQRFFRGWQSEVAQLEQRIEELEETIGEWVAAHTDDQYAHCNTKYCVTSDALRALAQQEEA